MATSFIFLAPRRFVISANFASKAWQATDDQLIASSQASIRAFSSLGTEIVVRTVLAMSDLRDPHTGVLRNASIIVMQDKGRPENILNALSAAGSAAMPRAPGEPRDGRGRPASRQTPPVRPHRRPRASPPASLRRSSPSG